VYPSYYRITILLRPSVNDMHHNVNEDVKSFQCPRTLDVKTRLDHAPRAMLLIVTPNPPALLLSRDRPTACLQGNAEDGQETTSEDGCTVLGKGNGGTTALGRTGGASGRGRARAAGWGTGARSRGRGRCNSTALGDGEVTAGGITSLFALEALVRVVSTGLDTLSVPEAAHLSRDGLLVGGHGGLDVGAVGALAGELEGLLAVC
jgi:hypothetical protein